MDLNFTVAVTGTIFLKTTKTNMTFKQNQYADPQYYT